MPQIRIPITLDLTRPNFIVPYITKIGDSNSRYIMATITNNGVKVDLPPQTLVRGNFVNVEGTGVYVSGEIDSEGNAVVMVPYGSFLKNGLMRCSISFVTSNPSSTLSTTHFDMFVEGAEEASVEIDPEEIDDYLSQIETSVSSIMANAFANLVHTPGNSVSKIMSQKGVTDYVVEYVESHSGQGGHGEGWTSEQISLLETVFGGIVYSDTTTQDVADALITSLRGSQPQPTQTYTVSFDMRGHGTQIASQNVQSGHTVTQPTDPVASGYTFGGWYTTSSFTTPYSFNSPVNSSFTLYAKWVVVTPVTHTVTFYMNGHGSPIEPITVNDGDTITAPTNPTASGFIFDGWYTNASLTTLYIFSNPVTSDITLYAKWTNSSTLDEIHRWEDFNFVVGGTTYDTVTSDPMNLVCKNLFGEDLPTIYAIGIGGVDNAFGDRFTVEYKYVTPEYYSENPEIRFTNSGSPTNSASPEGVVTSVYIGGPPQGQSGVSGQLAAIVNHYVSNGSGEYIIEKETTSALSGISLNTEITVDIEISRTGSDKFIDVYVDQNLVLHKETAEEINTRGFWLYKYVADSYVPSYIAVYNGLKFNGGGNS